MAFAGASVSHASPATTASSPDAARIAAAGTAVAQLEQRWVADLADGNRHDLATILANDYRDIDWQGYTRNKAELLAGLHQPPTSSQRITDLHVRVWGDTAVATGINHVQSKTRGWAVEVAFTDVFAHIDGHWRAVSSQETLRKPATPRAERSH
jgi:hypothetical protein